MGGQQVTAEQAALLNATMNMALFRLRLMFPDAVGLRDKEMEEAAKRAAHDLMGFDQVSQWLARPPEGEILQMQIRKPSKLVGMPEKAVQVVQVGDSRLPVDESGNPGEEFMHGLTIDAVVHSAITRALLYYRGFRLHFQVLKPKAQTGSN